MLHQPQVGSLTLRFEKLAVTLAPGQVVVIYHAGGAESADALVLLGHLAAQLEPTTRENGRKPA